ncbi:MAG TPA: hypothetical protein VE218_13580 [Acidobacteriaceae bacterium]|nr:hypothetical protein [Acidobacteriaceae bacterium]
MGQNDYGNSRWMGPILAVAVAGMAFASVPSVAQHGSGGHFSSGAGHFSGGAVRGGQGAGGFRANSFGARPGIAPSSELPRDTAPHWETRSYFQGQPNGFRGHGQRGNRADYGRRRNRVGYGVGFVGFPYYGYPSAFVDGDTDDDYGGDDTAQQVQPDAVNGPEYGPENGPGGAYDEGAPPPYPGPYADQGYPPPPPPRAPHAPVGQPQQPNSAAEQSDGLDHPAVTLVFNDGRPPLQVHSYALTGSSVFVAEEGHQRVIPITDLDLPATIAQNREAGVDFELPGGSR